YVENLRHSPNCLEYEFKGEWRAAEVRHETIEVRGGDSVEIDVPVTHHGPVISQSADGTRAIAFRYTATAEPNLGFESLLSMLMAKSTGEIDESMRQWVDPCNNFVFGDTQGNIGYLNRGQVPLRSMANAWLPVPGWTGEHEWEGSIPFEELTRISNPDNGFIVTANNRIVGKDYPHYIALDFAPEYRARRVYDRLKDMTDATVEDMAAVHSEIISIPAQVYSEIIARTPPRNERSTIAKGHMAGWDGSMDKDSVAPTIYSAFRQQLHRQVINHLLGPLADQALGAGGRGAPGHIRNLSSLLVTHAQNGDESLLPPGKNWNSLVASAFADGVHDLTELLGDDMDTWTWGSVHQTNPTHPLSAAFPAMAEQLDPPSVKMSGDGDTPQAGSFPASDPYTMVGMSVARYVWDTADWDNSRWVVPLGSSGHAGSPHYADQTSVWADVALIPATYTWDKVEAEALAVQTLEATNSGSVQTSYEGSHQQYDVFIEQNVMLEMRDGVRLATDIYFPAIKGVRASGQFPVILERTPYNKSVPGQATKAKFFARRGYVCVIQDVRGRLASEGEWHPFAKEAPDGFDTVEWLGIQAWSNGKVGTMGDSYAGTVQAALATMNPPHLSTMIVAVGASSYFDSSMRQNGALEQRFLIYAYRMAMTSHEADADPALKAAITRIFEEGMPEIVNQFPLIEGSTILSRFPTYEQWALELQQNGDYDGYWKQRGYAPVEYYEEHADVPT
ncbi:MAG: CocE/NonD family hydrolase, partial [Chloroflexi bacterium]|nr:CocE/NonD family hydrolase [Chloroflexota bacterium]